MAHAKNAIIGIASIYNLLNWHLLSSVYVLKRVRKIPLIQDLDPQEWIIQIKSVRCKSGKVASSGGYLGQALKLEILQVLLQQRENLSVMQKKS